MDEVEEQREAARRFEAAIAAVEPFLEQSDEGELSFGDADLTALDVDPDDLQHLIDSVDEVNTAIADGALALNDVNIVTPEVGRG